MAISRPALHLGSQERARGKGRVIGGKGKVAEVDSGEQAESDDVVKYCFPTTWPADRERRARYIGEWLKTEARYIAS